MEISQPLPTTLSESGRRRGVALPPLQTTFQKPSQRLRRPTPVQAAMTEKDKQLIPVEDAALRRKSSKGGIFGLFARNKSYKGPRSQANPETINEAGEEQKTEGTDGAVQPSTEADQVSPVVDGQCLARDISMVPDGQVASASPDRKRSRGGAARSKSFKKEPTTWDPPPLFQAYPQAIKHSSLSSPSISADVILRHQRSRKNHAPASSHPTAKAETDDLNNPNSEKRSRGEKKRQRAHEIILNDQWAQKIYVLVTSGYILQYAGDGRFDRLPEKIMPLCKDSAAFASDAIPGKPWVLRVCQETLDEDNDCSLQGSKAGFSPFTFLNQTRRSVSNFLLVIDSPEEMGEWLRVVRKEIQALGGKKYRPDVAIRRTSSEAGRALREKPSRRIFIKRDPNQFADRSNEQVESPSDKVPHELASTTPERRPSATTRKSTDSPSFCNTIISTEQRNLGRSRATPRMSYASNARTMLTSTNATPSKSPIHATFELGGNTSIEPATEYLVTPKSQRLSRHLLSSPPMVQRKSLETSTSQPASNSSRAGSSELSSPPHFSVPSYSKRYSVANQYPSRIAPPPSVRSGTIQDTGFPPDEAVGGNQDSHRTSILGELKPTPRTSPKGSKSLGNLSAHFSPPPPTTSFPPETSPGENMFSKAEVAVPRRFSSLEYSRGISPVPDASREHLSPSPHPPPTTALPALPGASSSLLPPGCHRHSIQSSAPSGKQGRNLHRPTSVQVRTHHTLSIDEDTLEILSKQPYRTEASRTTSAPPAIPDHTSSNCRSPEVTIPPPPARSAPPPPQQHHSETGESLPQIDQASHQGSSQLLRLPSIRVSQKGSLEGPWSAGYSNDGPHGVRAN